MERRLTPIDRCLAEIGRALSTCAVGAPAAVRPYPAGDTEDEPLSEAERRHAAGLMRVNHAGEICAQALYYGQALTARNESTRRRLRDSAREETDHLDWCATRLGELGSRASLLDPLWYCGSFAIGSATGLAGDAWSLGFVVETERQVESHLHDHLGRLPAGDRRSRAVIERMKLDEARHGLAAKEAGGRELPGPVQELMRRTAGAMKFLAYRI